MDFAIRNLSVLAYAQGFTLWHYRAGATALALVGKSGYFDDAREMFAAGDMVMVSAGESGKILFVTATEDSVTTTAMA